MCCRVISIHGRGEEMNKWNTEDPPEGIFMDVRGTHCWGDWQLEAQRKDYKKPKAGQPKNGFKKGWRWLDRQGNKITDVEAWREKE